MLSILVSPIADTKQRWSSQWSSDSFSDVLRWNEGKTTTNFCNRMYLYARSRTIFLQITTFDIVVEMTDEVIFKIQRNHEDCQIRIQALPFVINQSMKR